LLNANDIIKLRAGSDELNGIRTRAIAGDEHAAKTYVYWCAYQQIRQDTFLSARQRRTLFKNMVAADAIDVEVSFG
jgi:hypothetical protein